MDKGKVVFNKYKKSAIFIGIGLVALTTFGFSDDLFQIAKNLDVFSAVYKEININYVEKTTDYGCKGNR